MSKRLRGTSLILIGVMVGILLISPAGAHFRRSVTHLNAHAWSFIKPKVYTRAQANTRFSHRWAYVAANATIIDQSGGITVTDGLGSGRYYVDFGVSVANRSIMVTPAYAADASNDGVLRGAKTIPCSDTVPGGVDCAVVGDDPQTAYVEIQDAADGEVDTPFYIQLGPAS